MAPSVPAGCKATTAIPKADRAKPLPEPGIEPGVDSLEDARGDLDLDLVTVPARGRSVSPCTGIGGGGPLGACLSPVASSNGEGPDEWSRADSDSS